MTEKQKKRYHKNFKWHMDLYRTVNKYAEDILNSDNFQNTRNFIQHGSITVHTHCIDVAQKSLILSKALRAKVNEKEMIRGALLHDYFLYDWHDKEREDYQSLHGFYHPGIALKNANRDFDLTVREQDIIKKHMWPLTITRVPMYKESWIVTCADKYVSLMETLKIKRGNARNRIGKRGK